MNQMQYSFNYDVYSSYKELAQEKVELVEKAMEALSASYSPYSGFSVAAALLLENGEIVTGSNQENSAYPSGLCAERVAINTASHNFPNIPIVTLVVTASKSASILKRAIPPCGACRQVMLEVISRQQKTFEVILVGTEECIVVSDVLHLVPFRFDEGFLG